LPYAKIQAVLRLVERGAAISLEDTQHTDSHTHVPHKEGCYLCHHERVNLKPRPLHNIVQLLAHLNLELKVPINRQINSQK